MKERLDTAWDVMTLGFNDEIDDDVLSGEYLEERYGVDSDHLFEHCKRVIDGMPLDAKGMSSVFFMAFEFGINYEKYDNEMKTIFGT